MINKLSNIPKTKYTNERYIKYCMNMLKHLLLNLEYLHTVIIELCLVLRTCRVYIRRILAVLVFSIM